MSLIDLPVAKSQVRITSGAEDTLLQTYLDAAEKHTARFLNRELYLDDEALASAVAAVPASLTAAQAALTSASTAWWANPDDTDAPTALAWERAQREYREAKAAARRVYGGIVLNAPITQAILLLFGHFANNREASLTDSGSKALVLPLGYEALLDLWRIDEGV